MQILPIYNNPIDSITVFVLYNLRYYWSDTCIWAFRV